MQEPTSAAAAQQSGAERQCEENGTDNAQRSGPGCAPPAAQPAGSPLRLMELSDAATQLSSQEAEGMASVPVPSAALPDSLGFPVPELLPSQGGSELPSQPDIPIPLLASQFVPPPAPILIGSPLSPGYVALPLQAVPRSQAQPAAQLGGVLGEYISTAAAAPEPAPTQGGRVRRPTRRGPMDEMRQLVRILVKVRRSVCNKRFGQPRLSMPGPAV